MLSFNLWYTEQMNLNIHWAVSQSYERNGIVVIVEIQLNWDEWSLPKCCTGRERKKREMKMYLISIMGQFYKLFYGD